MKYIKSLMVLLKKKNLKKIAPALGALIVLIFGMYGTELNQEEVIKQIMVFGGLAGTILGIIANSDKK